MSEITELERRINGAMDRIAAALGAAAPGPAVDPASEAEIAALKQALEDEKLANSQLEERIKALRRKQETQMDTLRADMDSARDVATRLDADLQRLRRTSIQLRESVEKLRAANAEGLADPHLINKAMMAELDALRAERAVEAAEAEAMAALIAPLLHPGAAAADAADAPATPTPAAAPEKESRDA